MRLIDSVCRFFELFLHEVEGNFHDFLKTVRQLLRKFNEFDELLNGRSSCGFSFESSQFDYQVSNQLQHQEDT